MMEGLPSAVHVLAFFCSKKHLSRKAVLVPSQPPERLTPEEVKLVKETWKKVEEDAARVGAISFVR